MPVTRIETARSWSPEQRQYLIDSVHQSLVAAFSIPEHDKLIRLIEYGPGMFCVPPGCSQNYTLVEISAFPGRTLDAKRRLYQEIVERFAKLDIDPQDVRIVLYEVPADNWGIRGGKAASDVVLGYKLDV